MMNINLKDIVNYEINLLYNNDIFTRMTRELIDFDLNNWKQTSWYKYYKTFKPQSLEDIYQIKSETLRHLPPETIFEPWCHDKPIPLALFKRVGMFGEKDDNYIYNQIQKTKNILDSIKENGFQCELKDSNNIIIEVLTYKNKKKILVNSGNHRINILKALDYSKTIDVLVKSNQFLKKKNLINNKIYNPNQDYKFKINYDEADEWPAVKSGFIPLKEAQDMFLAYFRNETKIDFNL